ncbi:hypothetical protein [Spirulina sp. 06S082]|uniref:hypothetical protein n=1 Tax=Spirulina sp. 06S082 TaxID=3110248 RepID=UPI002B2002F4|nr:hypothetical protein [Spirulina sp. 06S082]MEA5470376.1 hypothetical protein [Spirulina sp. 06S082]
MKANKLLLLALPLFLFGCANLPNINISLGEKESQATKNLMKESCPENPSITLDSKNVELIDLSEEPITKSGIAHKSKGIAYTFDGEKDQKLDYEANKDICIWVYTPENEILSSGTLPITGKYTMQVTAIKASTTFDLKISLQDFSISSSPTVQATSTIPMSSPTVQVTPLSQPVLNPPKIQPTNGVGWIWLGAVNNTSGTYSYGEPLIPTTKQPVTITPSIVPTPDLIVTLKTGANIRSDVPKPPYFKLAPKTYKPLHAGQSLRIVRLEGFVDTNSDTSLTRIWAEVTFP